ncbi:geranylgeranyl-diphosphate geranylgeranyltransferase [Haloprofundus marisrubri]|uniref:Geranylgeranyl-diphosphate geranylgeranyltransferase n=1 Tax=Haloprofundus marisrubri TaxID=1514971 RepID=A0A0W1R991_9EURY|nr:phytoene/squalene synthase family protein [Haloprofundus marisrubri]KTG09269.1 geranylgeranyl-diphosphate geranylgeranyltransferase [Haloprofundus marisrubri]
MVKDDQVARSKAIQQRTGKTFHFATRLLPQRVRHATYVLYAFFRLADEVVDDAGDATPEEQRAELERLRAAAKGEIETDDPVLSAFSEMREEYNIDDADVDTFVDAMLTDITKSRYETYAELEAYMDGSAAAVGRMMTAVMDPEEREQALPHATKLGEAFQMSNFLRDVREDIDERDRIYLPQTTLREHDVTDEQIRRYEMSEGFTNAMESELHRTEALYREGVAGIKYLPEDCQFSVLLAAVLYADHHRLIRDRNYDVLSATPQLGRLRKLTLFARTRYHWMWTKDPEAVFWRVSSVSHRGSTATGPGRHDGLPAR